MADEGRRKVAVIVPAYNEAERIGTVLRAVSACRLADEIIVVDDGSADNTSAAAAAIPGVVVVRLPVNRGKGGAMSEGAKATKAPLLAFIDADLGGLRPEHLERIIQPLLDDKCDMCVGIFRGGKVWSDAAQRVLPILSGQRALKRELFEAVPNMGQLRFEVEVELNIAAKRRKARVLRVFIRGVSNCYKEQKRGFMKGAAERLKMYGEIGQAMGHAMVKTRRRRRRRPPTGGKWRWPK